MTDKHLWEIEHPYYCSKSNYYAPGNDQPVERYESWKDFFEAEGNSDPDMNLLFRWDWWEADLEEQHHGNPKERLMLFWIGQRKGLYRWSEIDVEKTDEPAIRAWLALRWARLRQLWEPVSLEPAR